MRRHVAGLTLSLGFLLLGGCATVARQETRGQASRPAVTIFGDWKEFWGTPGQTDVTYNDEYRIAQTQGGGIRIKAFDERYDQDLDARLDGPVLTFTQHTTFDVRYTLMLQDSGDWMIGTATTPEKVVNVKWQRTR